jgi:hypothetical protein
MALRIHQNGLGNHAQRPLQQRNFRDDIGLLFSAALMGALVPSMVSCLGSLGKSYALEDAGKIACITSLSVGSAALIALPALYLISRFVTR